MKTMRILRDLPIKRKLTIITMVTCCLGFALSVFRFRAL